MDIVELALTLLHEGWHHQTDRAGRHVLVSHSCGDCLAPEARARDPFYRAEDELRPRLEAARATASGGAWSSKPELGEVAAGVGLGVGLGVLLGAIINSLEAPTS
jgi:hypothetical protein